LANTKERILDTTSALFLRYGYSGTGLKQIVTDANAPFGSLYHFFPGGKQQLGDEVIRRSGQMYLEIVEAVFDAAPDLVTGVRDVFWGAAEVLRQTDYIDACPIATVALEVASSNDTLRQATADVFDSWIAATSARLARGGVPVSDAGDLATVLIQLLEGGFMLSRAKQTTEPMEAAGTAAVALVAAALPTSGRRRRSTAHRPAGG
jgi:MYXO-CTERM domain-containing protein